MTLWTQEAELVDQREVEEHGDKLIDHDILDFHVLHKVRGDVAIRDLRKHLEVDKFTGDNNSETVEVAPRCLFSEIEDEKMRNALMGSNDERKERVKKTIRNMKEKALVDLVERACLESIFVSDVDKWTRPTSIMHAHHERWGVRPLLHQSWDWFKSRSTEWLKKSVSEGHQHNSS